jgi:hypothetical protein
MIVTVNSPRGIDNSIAKLQRYLQEELFKIWGINPLDEIESAKFVFYPRVYRNQDEATGFIAELYTGGGNYREVYFDDTIAKGLSWFGQGSRITNGTPASVDIHLVTFARLDALYPAISNRADNEIREDFIKVLEAPVFGFTLLSTEIWLANVLREYPGSRRDNRLQAADMGQNHAFRLNLRLDFTPGPECENPTL